MARKTIKGLEEVIDRRDARITELKVALKDSKREPEGFEIHEVIDMAVDYFRKNQFVNKGVNSRHILSQLRSCRGMLRKATGK